LAIALASSGFLRSRFAFDARWSHFFRNGTFIIAFAIGRTKRPPWMRASTLSTISRTSSPPRT
jgi:hypothetical protein